ncbi:MAG: glycosyltransferase family 2 protein [Oscillatoriaceae cyanobacterium]
MIYLITVNYHSHQLIAQLLASLPPPSDIPYQFIIVNNSPDDTNTHQFQNNYITIIESGKNLGFGGGCNLGIDWVYQQNPQALIWLINPDTQLPPATLPIAANFFSNHPEISILGTVVQEPNGQIWFAGGQFLPHTGAIIEQKTWTYPENADYAICDWVTGCSLLLNLAKFTTCPRFDEAYFLYYEDFDFCQRYKMQGHIIAITNKIVITHQPSAINGQNLYIKYKHSTYSYLLSIHRYAESKIVVLLRWLRLGLNAIFLLAIKPAVARGKFAGMWAYQRTIDN